MTDSARVPQTYRVILVRHARSQVDAARPAYAWGLADEGRAGARRLAALALFGHAGGFYAGPEPKMIDTLVPVAAEYAQEVQTDPAFAESHSEGWLGPEAFLATVQRFFTSPDQPPAPGWEPATEAAARFAAGITRLRERHPPVRHPGHTLPGTFAVASGGRALTAYLGTLLGYTAEEAFAAWRQLQMPDLAVLGLSAIAPPHLVIPFGTLAPA